MTNNFNGFKEESHLGKAKPKKLSKKTVNDVTQPVNRYHRQGSMREQRVRKLRGEVYKFYGSDPMKGEREN